jgi:hypothetical protein
MSKMLREDICSVGAPGYLATDIESSRVEQCLPSEVQYACLYWVEHLRKSGAQLSDNERIHQFLRDHVLHWLEALSWLQKVSEGIQAVTSLESISIVSLSYMQHLRCYPTKLFFRRATVRIYVRLFMTLSGSHSMAGHRSSKLLFKYIVAHLFSRRR